MREIIDQFKHMTVLVIGDLMLDRYTSGSASRLSPEAPVLVLNKEKEYETLGGAANVANNIAALGGKAILCGVVGKDSERKALLKLLSRAHISSAGVIIDPTRSTTVKHRLMAGMTQLARFDHEQTHPLDAAHEKQLIAKIKPLVARADAIILSDYGKGVLTSEVVKAVKALARKHKKKIIADMKPGNHERFSGVYLITPNLKEAEAMTGENDVVKMGKMLARTLKTNVFITRGGDGISVFDKKGKHTHLAGKKVTVYDVSGAGDTVTAIAALSTAAGAHIVDTARLGNAAGQIVVQKAGTATASIEDILSTLTIHMESAHTMPKIWGEEKWIENNSKYCCKQLSIKKGYQCSLHYHKIKDETFLLTKGHVRLELGKDVIYMREGNFVRIPTGVPHRFRGLEDSIIIEISTHHDEADSYRIKGEESRKVRPNEK